MNFTEGEVLSFFRQQVWSKGLLELFASSFLVPDTSHNVLKKELAAVLHARKFGEATCRLVIPSCDAVTNRIYRQGDDRSHRAGARRQPRHAGAC